MIKVSIIYEHLCEFIHFYFSAYIYIYIYIMVVVVGPKKE